MTKNKYKSLRGGVKSFTEGFTGVINTGFSHLAKYSKESGLSVFKFDVINSASTPDLSDQQPWFEGLMAYIQVDKWCDQIGCKIEYIDEFMVEVTFDHKQYHSDGIEDWMPFQAISKIRDDRGKEYLYEHTSDAHITER